MLIPFNRFFVIKHVKLAQRLAQFHQDSPESFRWLGIGLRV